MTMTLIQTATSCVAISGAMIYAFRCSPTEDPETYRGRWSGITIQTDSVNVEFTEENEARILVFLAQEARQALEELAKPRGE